MARISKKVLSPQQTDELFHQLNTVIGKLSAGNADAFLDELLGQEERIMLAKRLGVIVMIAEGHTLYRVSQMLSVSSATAEKISSRIERGDYKRLIALLKKNKQQYLAIIDAIDAALHLGGILPRYKSWHRSR